MFDIPLNKTGALLCCEPDPMRPCVVQRQRNGSPTSLNKTQFWFVAKIGPIFAQQKKGKEGKRGEKGETGNRVPRSRARSRYRASSHRYM
jgi:hypothetical protein